MVADENKTQIQYSTSYHHISYYYIHKKVLSFVINCALICFKGFHCTSLVYLDVLNISQE